LRCSEELPQIRDLPLHLRHCRDRCGAGIKVVRETVDRNHAVGVQEQDRERRTPLQAAQSNMTGFGNDLERAEDAEVEHRRRTVAVR
jgi:hypothetical protein